MTVPWESHPQARFLSLFGRVTSTGRFIAEIDGMRFIAIAAVVIFHITGFVFENHPEGKTTSSLLLKYGQHGWFGVELFFVISGFILGQPFLSHYRGKSPPVNLRKYFMRRLVRLEPPYIIALLAVFALRVVVNGESASMLMPNLLASMGYLHSAIYGEPSPIIGGTWTLEIEVQFYILVPLIALAFFRIPDHWRRRVVIGAVMIAAALLQEWGEATRFTMSLANFIQFFLAGFLLADFYLIDWNERPTRSTLWDLLGVLSFALLLVNLNRNDYVFTRLELPLRLFSPFLILGLYCAILRGPMLNWTFTRPLLTTIGGMCYTIYLLHNTVLAAVGRYTWSLGEGKSFNTQLLIQHAVMIPPILVVSAVFFLLVEKPFMRADWLQRLKGRWGKPLPAAQEARSTE